jgi:hypothetical protein
MEIHLDDNAASGSIFRGLAASGWHTAAVTMRLLIQSDLKPAGGIVGAGFDDFASISGRGAAGRGARLDFRALGVLLRRERRA